MVVEQNPQIPDRTENLVGEGTDPHGVAVLHVQTPGSGGRRHDRHPVNTAHAFVERIQPYLSIPIISMLDTTVEHLRSFLPASAKVGLLATTGTVQSGIYADAIARVGLDLLVPDAQHQELVMSAIYGPSGVKAGHTSGLCAQQLQSVLEHLVDRGAAAVILGCTELPLLLAASEELQVRGTAVRVVDPTELLARRCVSLATGSSSA